MIGSYIKIKADPVKKQDLEKNSSKASSKQSPPLFYKEPESINTTPDLKRPFPLFYQEINSIHKEDNQDKPLNPYFEILEKIFSFLEIKHLLSLSVTNQQLYALVKLIKGLNIPYEKIKNSDIFDRLFKHNEIKEISVVNKKGFADILDFYNKLIPENITSIILDNCFLTEKEFRQLKLPQQLVSIELPSNSIGQGLDRLKTLTMLTKLNISNNMISKHMGIVCEMTWLIDLNIRFNYLSTFEDLKQLIHLKILDASNNPRARLSTLPTTLCSLTTLNLSRGNIKDPDLKHLTKNFTNLTCLILSENKITEKGVNELTKLPNLEQFEICDNDIDFSAINWTNFSKLRTLVISEDLTDEDKALIPKNIIVVFKPSSGR